MCGRYSLSSTKLTLEQRFALSQAGELGPRYNIAPTQAAVVIRQAEDGTRMLKAMRWGLVPQWAKDASSAAKLINARADSLADKPSFRGALRSQRCLVPMDGWFEWKREGKSKRPYYIHAADNRPFAVAGLWEQWLNPAHELVETFTVITVEAAPVLAGIHDRMPAVLQPESWSTWLDPRPLAPADLLPLLQPCDNQWPAFHEVGPEVGTVSIDRPGLILPFGGQGSLF
jgi:putative SOS response-associated peptidase YedK